MINKIHSIVSAYVLFSIPIEDKDKAQELLSLCETFGTVSMNVYIECLTILISKLDLDMCKLCTLLEKQGIDSKIIDELYPLPF